MKLLIELDEDYYHKIMTIKPVHYTARVYIAVQNGTPLNEYKADDCISRKEVEKLVYRYLRKETDDNIAFYEHIFDLPSVAPKSDKPSGKWIEKEHFVGCSGSAECSVCHERTSVNPHDNGFSLEYIFPKYCPNCGSLMEGGKTDAALDKHNRS